MRYIVSKNGENIIVTSNFKRATAVYNKCIYTGKPGDIIRMSFRKDPSKEWELVKKDWL